MTTSPALLHSKHNKKLIAKLYDQIRMQNETIAGLADRLEDLSEKTDIEASKIKTVIWDDTEIQVVEGVEELMLLKAGYRSLIAGNEVRVNLSHNPLTLREGDIATILEKLDGPVTPTGSD